MNALKLSKKFLTLHFVFMALSLSGCGDRFRLKKQPDLNALNEIEVVSGLGFSEVLDQVLTPYCLECHSTYDNYNIVAPQAQRLLNSILIGRMPKGKPALKPELQAVFKKWVDDGALEVASQEAPTRVELAPSYDSLLVHVFAPKCLACHSGDPQAPGPTSIDLSSYEKLIASNNLYAERFGVGFVHQEDGADSELIFLVTDPEEPMPPLALPGNPDYVSPPKVTEEEVKVLIDWIKKGFPEK